MLHMSRAADDREPEGVSHSVSRMLGTSPVFSQAPAVNWGLPMAPLPLPMPWSPMANPLMLRAMAGMAHPAMWPVPGVPQWFPSMALPEQKRTPSSSPDATTVKTSPLDLSLPYQSQQTSPVPSTQDDDQPLDLVVKRRRLSSSGDSSDSSNSAGSPSPIRFVPGYSGQPSTSSPVPIRRKAARVSPITSPTGSPPMVSPPVMISPHTLVSPPAMLGRRLKEKLVYEHKVLQMTLLSASATQPAAQRLLQMYKREVDRIELERHSAIAQTIDPAQQHMTQVTCDEQRLALAHKVRGELSSIYNVVSPPLPDVSRQLGSPPQLIPSQTTPPGQSVSPGSAGSSPSSSDSGNGSFCSPPPSAYRMSPGDASSPGKRKFLSEQAVKILMGWYEQHYDHPYPDDSTVANLATASGITPTQVKKWMANKRVRSCNTLAFNGSIHPKKLQKLMQLRNTSPESTTVRSKHVSEDKSKSKRFLSSGAIDVLSSWYDEHLSYPYPTDDEKKTLADVAGLTISQVTCWFANKRNRNNNTRRITPVGMIHKLNKKMQMYQNMQQRVHHSTDADTSVPPGEYPHPIPAGSAVFPEAGSAVFPEAEYTQQFVTPTTPITDSAPSVKSELVHSPVTVKCEPCSGDEC